MTIWSQRYLKKTQRTKTSATKQESHPSQLGVPHVYSLPGLTVVFVVFGHWYVCSMIMFVFWWRSITHFNGCFLAELSGNLFVKKKGVAFRMDV